MTSNDDFHGFDPEIMQIEREIADFFKERSPEFTGRHPIIAKVMAYFFTRRNLTQRDLQRLTGYSAGTISKSVRQLLDMNVIAKENIPGTHRHIYKMEELPLRSVQYFLNTEKRIEELEKELKELKDTLDTQAEEMQNLRGYQKIHALVAQLLELMPSYAAFIAMIDEEVEKIIKSI